MYFFLLFLESRLPCVIGVELDDREKISFLHTVCDPSIALRAERRSSQPLRVQRYRVVCKFYSMDRLMRVRSIRQGQRAKDRSVASNRMQRMREREREEGEGRGRT